MPWPWAVWSWGIATNVLTLPVSWHARGRGCLLCHSVCGWRKFPSDTNMEHVSRMLKVRTMLLFEKMWCLFARKLRGWESPLRNFASNCRGLHLNEQASRRTKLVEALALEKMPAAAGWREMDPESFGHRLHLSVSTVKLAMGAAGVPCGQRWSRGRRRGVVPSSPPEGLQFDPRLRPLGAAPNCGRNDATTEPRWLRGLSQSMQGRLSACSNGAEAMKVLEEVVSLGTLQEAAHQEEASYEDVAAALALLQQAKDKVARLEALREERRKQHAAEAAELRKRLEKERRRSLRQLLLRLAPPGSAFARKPAPGLLTSPLPSPRAERAKKAAEVVEQGPRCFEPVTQAA
eukprot:s2478_g7.t1